MSRNKGKGKDKPPVIDPASEHPAQWIGGGMNPGWAYFIIQAPRKLNTSDVVSSSPQDDGKQNANPPVVDVDSDHVFIPAEWIGIGKRFGDVPFHVSDACRSAREIPSTFACNLPSRDMTVSEFLRVRLPRILKDTARFSRRTSDWFSPDVPNCKPDALLATVIPPLSFVRDLEQGVSQAWLNGTKSLVHPTDKNIRLPLWSIPFFRKIIDLRDAQEKWAQSKAWLPTDALYLLDQVEWDSTHPGAPDGQADWTRLIDNEWLSGGNIDSMIHHVQTRLSENPVLESSTMVAPLSFQKSITKFATEGTQKVFLRRFVDAIKSGKTTLYFPLHVDNNHWIAFKIDFARKTFCYGDSMARSSKPRSYPFISYLEKWLAAEFSGGFTNLGDCLTHSAQKDYIHCGIYTINTLEHALFGDRILGLADCARVRLEWFKKFMHRAGLDAITQASAPADRSHENSHLGLERETSVLSFPPVQPPVAMSLQKILNPAPSEAATPANNASLTESSISVATPGLAKSTKASAVEASIEPNTDNVASSSKSKAATQKSSKVGKKRKLSEIEDRDESDEERSQFLRERTSLLAARSNRAKEKKSRAGRTTATQRLGTLMDDVNCVKTPAGVPKGTPYKIYCRCRPNVPVNLLTTGEYLLGNWTSHQNACELLKKVKPGAPTQTVKKTAVSTKPGISAFFIKKTPVLVESPLIEPKTESPIAATKRNVHVGDQRLDASYFSSAPRRLVAVVALPPTELETEVECRGLHGDGYQQYAWQTGECFTGGVSAIEWIRISHYLFPYKLWSSVTTAASDSEDSDSGETDTPDVTPDKVLRESCALSTAVKLGLDGALVQQNNLPERALWTDYEKKRLHQSLLLAARWIVYSSTGSVFAKRCLGVTTSLTRTCSACTEVGKLPGLKHAIRRARARADLPRDEFSEAMKRKITHTPTILSDNAAANAKASLANPAVVKLLSSKAMYGPVGAFLSLFQQAQQGDLDDYPSFVAICAQLTDKVERNKDPTGHAIHGIRYDATFMKFCTLMRSYGPRSGAQYDLLTSMVGGISQRQLRRNVAKSAHKMVTAELCAENLESAVQFGKRMDYQGPWICAGDGTKLRALLTMSTECSESGSAHVVGSTLSLCDTLFKSSEEQSKIISTIDAAKAIATQVWVLAIKIPLPGMPLFAVTFVPNKGTMKAPDYCDLHLGLRELCGEAGLKLLASGPDGAKAEVNAQQLMMDADTEERLSYTNKKHGVFISCPVYADTGPHISCTDPDHARKTIRNNFFYGTHLLILGFLFVCHAVFMALLMLKNIPLYVKDIFNPDKQDDGAARRLFSNTFFRFLVNPQGNLLHEDFGGLFILTFVFGELFDAYSKRDMTHIERVVCIFRARHFLTIWRLNIVKAGTSYPDLFPMQGSFLADSSFQIFIRLCDQFILLLLAHLEHYPNVPFMPWHYGSHFMEHFFGISRSFISDFSFGQFIEMYKHISLRQLILASGQYNTKKDKDSNNGYTFEFADSDLSTEEITALKQIPSRADIDRACSIAWNEAAALASQFCSLEIPTLPLASSDLHPLFRRANGPADRDDSSDDGATEDQPLDEGRPQEEDEELADEDEDSEYPDDPLPGSRLSVSQSMAHAAHHVLTEQYMSEEAEKCEAELAAIHDDLERDPDTEKTVSGRMRIADLLNPIDVPPPSLNIPTFLPSKGLPIGRLDLVAQRDRHCAATHVHSEKDREQQTDVQYLGGKFSLNHAAHQLKEQIQQSEGLRTETHFQKGRYKRWILSGPPKQWNTGINLHASFGELVPHIRIRGVTTLTPMCIDSLVMMRTGRRLYLGKVLGIYRYGSVSGNHESYTEAETVKDLSYISLEVYEQMGAGRNIFQHVTGRGLALFTHAPIREFVYLMNGAGLRTFGTDGMCSMTSGDNGWERWNTLCREEVLRIMRVPVDIGDVYDEEEEDYEEEDVETGKKRRPKPPRGAIKRQRVAAPAPPKPQRKKNAESEATAARKATVKRLRHAGKTRGGQTAKK
ncbi:hypothetical protein DFH06DRAFT_1292967 [Mycena polygramma]|nr:hypothetical protein DFH06DRAFT_1292967 [Mycena polygramma]